MDKLLIGIIFLFVQSFIIRIVAEKAMKKLDEHQKAGMIDLFSKQRIYGSGVMIVALILFFASLKYQLLDPQFILWILWGVLLLNIFISSYLNYKKLNDKKYPKVFIKGYLIRTIISCLGFLIFMAIIS